MLLLGADEEAALYSDGSPDFGRRELPLALLIRFEDSPGLAESVFDDRVGSSSWFGDSIRFVPRSRPSLSSLICLIDDAEAEFLLLLPATDGACTEGLALVLVGA